MAKIYSSNSLESKFGEVIVYTQTMKVKDVINISYVAVRGRDNEAGAVQRPLNKQRLLSIKQFVLKGGMFFNTFILNWTDKNFTPKFQGGSIDIPIVLNAAQVIDGQHRIEGLRDAIEDNNSVGEQDILVTLCIGLNTKQAAEIFININSEQKPVPKSLIFDLFGEIDDNFSHAINRANDIAQELDKREDSPYYGVIKFPGKPKGVGYVDLSTVVSSLKKSLESDGMFATINLTNLENQKIVIFNYFTALRFFYDREDLWLNKAKNPFFTNAGFFGATEYLISTLLIKCSESKKFSVEFFIQLLNLEQGNLLTREDIKNLEGKSQRKQITDYLKSNLTKSLPEQDEYEF
jgi:DGQHR domain-containing protein